MDLTQLANLGEFIGGVAVLVTLVYLATQVRQNTAQARLASMQGVLDSYNALNRETFLNRSDTAEINRRGLFDFESLGPDERYVFHLTQSEIVLHAQSVLEHYEAGLVRKSDYDAWMAYMASILRCAGSAQWWNACRWTYTASIRDALEEHLRATEGEPSYTDRMPFFDDFDTAP